VSHASNAEGELTFASVSKARGGVTSVLSNIPHDLETLELTLAIPINLFILLLYIVHAIVRLLHHAVRLAT
jgi:hypothetical protein